MSLPPLDDYARVGQHWPIYLRRAEVEQAVTEGLVLRVYPGDVPASIRQLADTVQPSAARWTHQDATYTGIRVQSGRVELEHNRDLDPSTWRGSQYEIGIVDRMVREDPVMQAIRLALTLPLESVDWTWQPADDSEESWAQMEVVRSAFDSMPGGLLGWLSQADDYTWRGFSLGEPVYRFDRDFTVVLDDRVIVQGATLLDRIVPILPWAVYRWEPYAGRGWGAELYPYTGDPPLGAVSPPSWSGARLAPEELVHIRYQPEGDTPEPMGALRPCYGAWQSRRTYAKLELTGFQRGAYGIPYVEVDPSAGARPADMTTVNTLLANLRAGLRASFTLPRGYTLRFAEFPFDAASLRSAMTAAGRDAARAAWASMVYTGEDNGTQALIGGQQSFFLMLLEQQARTLIEALKPVVQRLVGMNFGKSVRRFPTLTHGPWKMADVGELVTAITTAATAGALTLTGDVEGRVRDLLGLAPMPEPVVLAWEARAAAMDEPEPEPEPEPTQDGGSEGVSDDVDDAEEDGQLIAAADSGVDRYGSRRSGDVLIEGPQGRALRPEERCVRLSETAGRTRAAKEELAEIVASWRAEIAEEYAAKVAAAPDLVAAQRLKPPGVAKLARDLGKVLARTYAAGRESIAAELERQERDPKLRAEIASGMATVGEGGSLATPATLSEHPAGCGCRRHVLRLALAKRKRLRKPAPAAGQPPDDVDDIRPTAAVSAVAESTANAAADRMKAAAVSALQSAGRGGSMPSADAGASVVRGVIDSLSVGQDLLTAQGDANTIFGLGRDQEGRAQGVGSWVYSNLLESMVCSECESRDGDEFSTADLDTYSTPASWCLGGDSCNCLCIAILPED